MLARLIEVAEDVSGCEAKTAIGWAMRHIRGALESGLSLNES